jgi:DNA mismatch endonuclease (patch repair protein)
MLFRFAFTDRQYTQPTVKISKVKNSLAKPTRSELMSRIRSRNTRPEKLVRGLLFAMGYRFRIHRKDLPGCPDIVFVSKKKAIFINGCFWHQHQGCPKANLPMTNQHYWLPKLDRNRQRDEEVLIELMQRQWDVLIIWECEIKELSSLSDKLKRFLEYVGPLPL